MEGDCFRRDTVNAEHGKSSSKTPANVIMASVGAPGKHPGYIPDTSRLHPGLAGGGDLREQLLR